MTVRSDVNKTQIGGTHYKSGRYDHWDWVTVNGIVYLPGVATKYLCRWRTAYGMKDLKKVKHYIEKMIEMARMGILHNNIRACVPGYEVRDLVYIYNLDSVEEQIIELLTFWHNVEDLRTALKMLEGFMEHVQGEPPTRDYVDQD